MEEQPYLKIELDNLDSVPRVWFGGTEVYVNSLVDLELLWSTRTTNETDTNVVLNVVGYNTSHTYPIREVTNVCSGKYLKGVE